MDCGTHDSWCVNKKRFHHFFVSLLKKEYLESDPVKQKVAKYLQLCEAYKRRLQQQPKKFAQNKYQRASSENHNKDAMPGLPPEQAMAKAQ